MANADLAEPAELVARLENSFRTTTGLLQSLLEGMRRHRAAWMSARPSTLRPSRELEQLAAKLGAEDRQRHALLAQFAALLPRPEGVAAADLHLNVTRIEASLPRSAGRSLRAAADEATTLARTVRSEVALGQRLLRFTKDAQDSLIGGLVAKASAAATAVGYDKSARCQHGPGGNVSSAAGRLIDGRI